ncbi:hypothetical protein SEA_SCHWARTZ33_43 [Gordonia phage Schwartz33]|nr:hypothetical protein SEA_SCHWARTZ33_43 [Gordonia phage Schwartz33]
MSLHSIVAKSHLFFNEHRGRMGLSYGIFIGFALAYYHLNSMRPETELVVTDQDAMRMLEEDTVAVYQTKYGPIFVTMNEEAEPLIEQTSEPMFFKGSEEDS